MTTNSAYRAGSRNDACHRPEFVQINQSGRDLRFARKTPKSGDLLSAKLSALFSAIGGAPLVRTPYCNYRAAIPDEQGPVASQAIRLYWLGDRLAGRFEPR
jgi:hypothetical protein